ncbi:TPA: hypothetical protein NBM22_003509 [Klebsiella pneumoniae]|uniref:hypothetical protein n=1 Tax=Klebsiella TaxID=570 RepID=UPI0017823E6E|nr:MULTISPECIES: hypothetical protein [Klebsiella]HCI4543839.1 hypothetical protein [Klebsiella quasipneumoniae subsp. quasipneumoniae]HCI6151753.1 hypothetical protein [Klebsiella variicola subsp. variicola]HDX8605593.1 hypothetical protein [Klebsiella michiganensis]MBD8429271.1 hypothetical protein [Klebsiella pneumoniae]MCA4108004.1 hypothetical protein [Klebsiella pneumoniae]
MDENNQPEKHTDKPANSDKWTLCDLFNPFIEVFKIFTSKDEKVVENAAESFQMRIQKLIFLALSLLLLAKGLFEVLQTLSFLEQPIKLNIPPFKEPLIFYKDHGLAGGLLRIKALVFIANALALSCGFQLAYMLVTKGPDEAVEPIMLGIASAILLILSDSSPSAWGQGKSVAIFLLIISIPILYWSSRQMKEDKKNDTKKDNTKKDKHE